MSLEPLAERARYFKETEEGVSYMCKMMEDRLNDYGKSVAEEAVKKNSAMIAENLIKAGPGKIEDIAKATGLSSDEVQKIKENLI